MTTTNTEVTLGSLPPRSRRCGRCRRDFPGDANLDDEAQRAWWLCPPCRIALLGPPQTARRAS